MVVPPGVRSWELGVGAGNVDGRPDFVDPEHLNT